MIATVLLMPPRTSRLRPKRWRRDTRAKLRFFKGLLHCRGVGLCIASVRSEPGLPAAGTPGMGRLAEANSDPRETLRRADLDRVIDEIAQSWPVPVAATAHEVQPHQPTPHCRPSPSSWCTVATTEKSNTTSNAFGVERSDSLTLVTSWIASATHQNRPVRHPPDTPLSTSWLVPVQNARSGCGSRRTETASPKICRWLTGSLSIAQREIDSRQSVPEACRLTGPRGRSDSLCGEVSQSVPLPFFAPLQGRANRAPHCG